MKTLTSVPDKVWLLIVLVIMLAIFAYRPEPIIQKWTEYAFIALIAVLRNGAQTTVIATDAATLKEYLDGRR